MNYSFPVLAILIWAGNTVVTKMSAGAIFPAEIGFYRWLLAGLLFTPFLLPQVWRNRTAIRPLLGKLFVLGVLGMVMYQSMAYFAAGITSATNMGIILSLMPLMSLALSIAWLGQRLTYGASLGALVSFFGVLEVVSAGNPGALLHQGLNGGDLLMLVATFAYALYSVLLKKWQLRLPQMQLLYLQIWMAILVLLPMYLLSEKTGLTANNIGLVLYACVLASMIAPQFWMQAVHRLGPTRTTLFFNLLPVVTAVIAAGVLNEQLASYHLYGGLLTLAGVILAERWTTPVRRALTARQP